MKKVVCLIFLFLFSIFAPAKIYAKSYTVGQVQVEATLNPDGSMNVVENRLGEPCAGKPLTRFSRGFQILIIFRDLP